MAARADLLAAYTECQASGDGLVCEQIAESVAELDAELRAAGVRGRLTPLDPLPKPVKRSTRRRQDAPDLPRRPIERRTVGRVFAGRYRPSTFLTLTLDSYGRVDSDGAAVDPEGYDYRRAARDAIHFPALLDRFWQNTRRCVGWDVQYFGTVEPQNAVPRISMPRSGVRSPVRSCGRSRRRPITRCGGLRMTSSCTPTGGYRSGTAGRKRSLIPTPGRRCRVGSRRVRS